MTTAQHIKNTKGQGREIHLWIDRFAWKFGLEHRIVLHHQQGIELVVKEFGEEARWIAEQHMKDDWVDFGDKIPTGYDDKEFFRDIWAVNIDMFLKAQRFAERMYR
jgi:hypothetical protein